MKRRIFPSSEFNDSRGCSICKKKNSVITKPLPRAWKRSGQNSNAAKVSKWKNRINNFHTRNIMFFNYGGTQWLRRFEDPGKGKRSRLIIIEEDQRGREHGAILERKSIICAGARETETGVVSLYVDAHEYTQTDICARRYLRIHMQTLGGCNYDVGERVIGREVRREWEWEREKLDIARRREGAPSYHRISLTTELTGNHVIYEYPVYAYLIYM